MDPESQRKVATLYERKCLSLINAKRFDEAEAYLAKALAVNSTKESLLVLKASILAEQGDFSKWQSTSEDLSQSVHFFLQPGHYLRRLSTKDRSDRERLQSIPCLGRLPKWNWRSWKRRCRRIF